MNEMNEKPMLIVPAEVDGTYIFYGSWDKTSRELSFEFRPLHGAPRGRYDLPKRG